MRKYLLAAISVVFVVLGGWYTLAYAACTNTFPVTFNNYVSGNCIPSAWGNSLEQIFGQWPEGTSTSIYSYLHGLTASTTIRSTSSTINSLTDFNGNKYSTSTSAGGGVTTSSVLTQGQWVIASGPGSIYSTSSQPAITAFSPLSISPTGTILCSSCLTSLSGALLVANNLSDVNNVSSSLVNLRLSSSSLVTFGTLAATNVFGGDVSSTNNLTVGGYGYFGNNLKSLGAVTGNNFVCAGSSVPALGIGCPAANTLTLYTASTRALQIDSSQNVQIFSIASSSQLYANSSTIQFLYDASGNQYSTSTSKGTVTTSSAMTQGQWVIAGGAGSIYSTSSQPALSVNATSPLSSSGVSATGTVTISCTTCVQADPIQWTVGNETTDNVDGIFTFNATGTMKSCFAGNVGLNASGSVTFNLGFTTSTSNPTSTWEHLFSTDQTVASIGTSTKLTVNGSTTFAGANPGGFPWQLGYWTDIASSSEFSVTCHYTTP